MMYRWILFLFISFFAFSARAQNLREMWMSVRAMGMGNAYSGIVDDADALFYNPAGLAKIRGLQWTLFDPAVGANGIQAYDAYKTFSGNGTLEDKLREFYGKKYWAHVQLKSTVALPGVALGVFGASDLDLRLENPAYSKLYLNSFNDYGITGGTAVTLVPRLLTVGMSLRRTTRIGSAQAIGASSLSSLSTTDIEAQLKNKGTAYAADFGLNLEIPTAFPTTFSFVWKNIGNTQFSHESGAQAPQGDRNEMIVALATQFELPIGMLRAAIDYKYISWEPVQMGRKINMGAELDLPALDLRAGFHQGYFSYGVGIDLALLRLDVASYGAELGVYPGQYEDRRYMLQLSMDMNFNAGQSLSSGTVNPSNATQTKSRLKPRR